MLGWNDASLYIPDGLSAGNRSFIVRITRLRDANIHHTKKRSIEATITLRVHTSLVMGIDLGTTYGCIAYVNDDTHTVIPIPLDHDQICMPMMVAFHSLSSYDYINHNNNNNDNDETSSLQTSPIVMGMAAKKLSSIIPDRVVRDLKRIIGRTPRDYIVKEFQSHMSFTIIDCNDGHHHDNILPYESPCIRVNMSTSLVPLLADHNDSTKSGQHSK
jgi:hypothetical protein